MKKYMPLEGLRWSRDSGSALYDTPQTAVLGRAGGGLILCNEFSYVFIGSAVASENEERRAAA